VTGAPLDRTRDLLEHLDGALAAATQLVARGRAAFDSDEALPLAFEALSNRVGDLCKKLVALEPVKFGDPIWVAAIRHRDFLVHHYFSVDREILWNTVADGFRELETEVRRHRT
jgi:uncharacterized protein with HEPN domain